MRMTMPEGSPFMRAGVVVGEGGMRLAEGALEVLVIQSNSFTYVNMGIMRLTASAVDINVAGTVIDSVTTLLSLSLHNAFLLIWLQIWRLTGYATRVG